jgi:hypothetical protein
MATSLLGLFKSLLPTHPHIIERRRHEYSPASRVQVLTLLYCTPGHLGKEKYDWITSITGVAPRTQRDINKKAKDRGFNPEVDLRIRDEYVVDEPRTGRPITAVTEEIIDQIMALVRKDRNGREKSGEVLGFETGISPSSALRALKKGKMRKCKPLWKPGLDEKTKLKRYQWCKDHEHWHKEGPFPGTLFLVLWSFHLINNP